MKNKWSRLLALLLTVTIVFNTVSGTAYATETGGSDITASSEMQETAESQDETEAETETEAGSTSESEEEDTTEVSVPESESESGEETAAEVTEGETVGADEEYEAQDEPEYAEETGNDGVAAILSEADESEEAIVVIAASDYQNTNGGYFSSGASTDAYAIMNQIKEDYSSAYGFLFGGDYYAHSTNTTTESTTGKNQLKKEIVDILYPDMADDTQVYIQGNHDADSLTTNGTLATSGAHDTDYYGVYVINEKDYMWYNDSQSTIQSTASALDSYLEGKASEGYDKPIFVLSHLPLHYTNRTKNEGDGKYAKYLYDVLDEAGDNGLNIVFLYGHNHSTAYDTYLGNGSVYLAEGDSIAIANEGSTSSYFIDTLSFTYMDYGFVGYIGSSDADSALTMTVFEITDSTVTVKRYDEDGEHNLKAAGGTTQLPSGLSANTTVYESGQTIELTAPAVRNTVTDSATGVSVKAPGLTGLTVTKAYGTSDTAKYDSALYSAYASYDITPVGYTQGNTATVTITLNSADRFDSSKQVIVIDKEKGTTQTVEIVDGSVTFTTDHFSTYDLAQTLTFTIEGSTSSTITVWRQVTSFTANKRYLLVNYGENASGVGTYAINSSAGATGVTVLTDSTGAYIESADNAIIWTAAKSGNYFTLQNASNSVYLKGNSTSGTNSVALSTSGSASNYCYWSMSTTGSADTSLAARQRTNSSSYYVVRYSNGDSAFKIYTSSQTSKYDNWIALFEETVTTVEGSSDVTITFDSSSGSVKQGASATATTGSKLTVTDADGNETVVNITVGMLKDADGNVISTEEAGTLTGLRVYYTYDGTNYLVFENFTLTITEKVQNNYPDYPNEGAVEVNKTATGIDFQSSGVAQVELSVSGVPSKKGADVIIMLDTSSSMTCATDGNDKNYSPASEQRITYLRAALTDLLEQFQAVGEDGEVLDIRVAIADFNGYTHIDSDHHMEGTTVQTATQNATVFTGDGSLTAGAFVQASSINATTLVNQIDTHSGTNYDYAFEATYLLGSSIQTANETNGEERDLYVVFMSDGAPYQFNYYGSQSAGSSSSDPEVNDMARWNYWMTGTIEEYAETVSYDPFTTWFSGSPNTHFYNENGTNWTAEAIKGSSESYFDVIDAHGNFATNVTVQNSTKGNYFTQVPGLGATMYTIGFCLMDDYGTTKESMETLLTNLASSDANGNKLYYSASSGEDISSAFASIGSEIAYAASNAYFLDQMGTYFDLQLATVNYAPEGSTEKTETITPVIEVKAYDIYTRQDWIDGNCEYSQIGDRKGTYSVIETVTFSADGTKAYSSLIDVDKDGTYGVTVNSNGSYAVDEGDNIVGTDGVIYAYNFAYNTTAAAVTVNGVVVGAESFYWKVGTVTTTELAISYYVYLTGSMEGTREAGSYATNNYATLYYENYLGNDCYKDTVSPSVAWESALVKYAFYLVDSNGNPVNNNGEIVTFANKVAVTQPVIYEEILLNNLDNVNSIEVASLGALPEGYTLYDTAAVYTVKINSNSTGEWTIVKGKDVATTYVMQYDPDNGNAHSNALEANDTSYDYTHTVVWFAVVWTPQCVPDTVVIDYGLPVEIHVLGNDMFGDYGKLVGIAAGTVTGNVTGDAANKAAETTVTGTYGTAEVITTKDGAALDKDECVVRYTPNTMAMNDVDTFTYSVNYTGGTNNGYYYGAVTVIPATTVYYEDSFVSVAGYNSDGSDNSGVWMQVGKTIDSTQDEDRPGYYSLSYYDTNNIYGYDSAYTECSEYSLGSAMKAAVNSSTYGTATFTFYGTGFDIIGMTSNKTGVLKIKVYDENSTLVDSAAVDTYYGYAYGEYTNEDGETDTGWYVTSTADENALYQIPVMQINGLEYGKYTVVLTASYYSVLDHNTAVDGYDLYIDAVRIYDPAGTTYDAVDSEGNVTAEGNIDDVIQNAYLADQEGWPVYEELRNNVIAAADVDGTLAGVVIIDGIEETAKLSDYTSYGPNNELYLASGQAVAFNLDLSSCVDAEGNSIVDSVRIGIKSADGSEVNYKIFDGTTIENSDALAAVTTKTISTSTDMYYDITSLRNATIVICNSGSSGILSVTNIKITFTANPGEVGTLCYVSDEVISAVIDNMNTEPAFTPKKIEVSTSPNKIYEGNTITVTVTTSDEVATVSVNGTVLSSYRKDRNGNLVWTVRVKAETAGTLTIEVIAHDKNGIASESKNVDITVNSISTGSTGADGATGGKTAHDVINDLLTWLENLLGGN